MQGHKLVAGTMVAGLRDCGRRGGRAVDLLKQKGVFERMEAWLLFEIVGDEELGMRLGRLGSEFVVGGADWM